MTIVSKLPHYSAFQIDELHRHNQNLVGTLHKGVPTVVYRHENCCMQYNEPVNVTGKVVKCVKPRVFTEILGIEI
jgi:hypothetical protein